MRPTTFFAINPAASTEPAPSFGILTTDQTDPRLRNRIHNQAQRLKANIGKRRVLFPSATAPNRRHASTSARGDDDKSSPASSTGSSQQQGLTTARRQRLHRYELVDDFIRQQLFLSRPHQTVTSGGIRGDPFNAYPIPAKGVVSPAVDYFLQDYAPVHISPKKEEMRPDDSSNSLAKRYFSLALENIAMFEIMVALSEASRAFRLGFTSGPTPDVLLHYVRGVRALRHKIEENPDIADDATLFAVMALMGIAYIYGDFDTLETHLVAARHIIALRGGVDNLGWHGFIKASIIGLEAMWAFHSNKQLLLSPKVANVKISYPRHPFPPDLCTLISKLPEGFAELALSGDLSLQIIERLVRVSQWVRQVTVGRPPGEPLLGEPTGTNMKETMRCVELLALPHLRLQDRVICMALVVCTLEAFKKQDDLNPVHFQLIRKYSQSLKRYELMSLRHIESITWVALTVAGSAPKREPSKALPGTPKEKNADGAPESIRTVLLNSIMRRCQSVRNRKWVKRTLQKFFYTDKLLASWLETWESALIAYRNGELLQF